MYCIAPIVFFSGCPCLLVLCTFFLRSPRSSAAAMGDRGSGMGKKIRIDAKYILTELSAFNVKSIRIT